MLFLSSVLELEPDVPLQQHHQRVDFGARALPVLDRERVERQHVDAQPGGRLDDVAHRVDAGAVPLDARQVALRRPAAVAVHDDGDVRGQPLEVDLARQRFVGRSWRNPRQELLKRHAGSIDRSLRRHASYSTRTRNRPRRARSDPPRARSRDGEHVAIHARRPAAASDLDERADDGADHVAEEAVAANLVDDRARPARDRGSPLVDARREHRRARSCASRCRPPGTRRSRGALRAARAAAAIASTSSAGAGTCQAYARSNGLSTSAFQMR